jgi:hypothetical protein
MKFKGWLFVVRGLVILFFIAGCAPQPVPNVTNLWYVSPAGNDNNTCQNLNSPCLHIATALERAADGNIIYLAAGTYTENLVIQKSITISGKGSDSTFLDGVVGSVIQIGNYEGMSVVPPMTGPSTLAVSLTGFTIEKGVAIDDAQAVYGAGLLITDGTVTLTDIQLFQNIARFGGGMFVCNQCVVTATGLKVRGNQAVGTAGDNSGGGILSSGSLSLTDSLIEMNTAEKNGGGIVAGLNLTLNRVQIIHNLAGISGGGIFHVNGDATLTNVDFQSNEAQFGAGMLNIGIGTVLIQNSDFLGNKAGNFGGALANMTRSHLTMVNDTLSGNQAGGFGGGIGNGFPADFPSYSVTEHETAILNAYNLTIAYNQAPASAGGGLYTLDNGQSNFINTLFVENTAENCVGAVTGDGNMLTDASCSFDGPDNYYGVNPLIDPSLNTNGGVTLSHALLPNSPAIDAGVDGPAPIPTEDQRGKHRPQNGDGYGEARIDIGAYEADEIPSMGLQQPIFVPKINSNCHQGPGLNYGVPTFGLAGTSYPIQGRSQDGFWFYIQYNESMRCWMSADTGETRGDLSALPVVEAPPISVERPAVVCTDYLIFSTCQAHSECKWVPLSDISGYCINK